MKNFIWAIIFLIPIFLSGCSTTHDVAIRVKHSQDIATQNNFQMQLVNGGDFTLTTYQRITDSHLSFVFYIEGDGHLTDGSANSDNPTPVIPMLLKLATIDKRPNVVYIARPCQYTPLEMNTKCISDYWLDKRMNQEVVNSINNVINTVNNGQKFSFVGFSGGGGLTILIAAQNSNVKDIITIAGNLDTEKFDKHHNYRGYLVKSLNPINYARQVNNIPQLHLSGMDDKRVPPFIAEFYVKTSGSPCVKKQTFPNISHAKGWDKVWSNILDIPLICN
ncbi:alpha/beta hydrolase [Rickettsia endosymbiont of Cantharis rufa]|uniref:alpha/beta hydrolase n=1 Tax=Rickettsia endosymbiont of Cantharis rufa TaxID=3066248 RepID=UPI003132FE7E